jgi:hypothetical protein
MARVRLPPPRPCSSSCATTRAFPDPLLRAWVWHDLEEFGDLEHLLPPLVPRLAPDVPASAS